MWSARGERGAAGMTSPPGFGRALGCRNKECLAWVFWGLVLDGGESFGWGGPKQGGGFGRASRGGGEGHNGRASAGGMGEMGETGEGSREQWLGWVLQEMGSCGYGWVGCCKRWGAAGMGEWGAGSRDLLGVAAGGMGELNAGSRELLGVAAGEQGDRELLGCCGGAGSCGYGRVGSRETESCWVAAGGMGLRGSCGRMGEQVAGSSRLLGWVLLQKDGRAGSREPRAMGVAAGGMGETGEGS